MNGTIGDDVITDYCARVIDAAPFGKTYGIVREASRNNGIGARMFASVQILRRYGLRRKP